MSAVVALAGVSIASPFVVKNDAFAKLAGHHGKSRPAVQQVVAGGFQYSMPASWGQLGSEAAETSSNDQAAGTVVTGVCPGGDNGAACDDGVQVTFVAYDGAHGKLPLPTSFEASLNNTLPKRMPGFHKISSATGPSSDGTTWLRYEFSLGSARAPRQELLGAFRHDDGSGVVAVAVGPRLVLQKHRAEIVKFLASGQDVSDDG